MNKLLRNYVFNFGMGFLLIAASGCAPLIVGAAVGAGSMAYAKGDLEKNLEYPVENVHSAALEGLKDLGVFVKADALNRHSANISGEFDDGKKIQIHITALTERSSKLVIRVGILGNEPKSRMILNAVLNKL